YQKGKGCYTSRLKWFFPILILTASLFLGGCGGSSKNEAADSAVEQYDNNEYYPAETEAETLFDYQTEGDFAEEEALGGSVTEDEVESLTVNRKIILNYNVTIRVDDIAEKQKAIIDVATELGGYVESYTICDDQDASAHLVIRIPAKQAETFNTELSELGTIKSSSADATDVTFEHQDLAARLKNAERQNEKLQEYLEQAETVEDMLAVQREIDAIQERIEQLRGQIKYYDDQVAFSTFYIGLQTDQSLLPQSPETPSIVSGSEFGEKVKSSFNKGWVSFVNALANLVVALAGAIIPIIILVVIGLVVVFIVLKSSKRSKRKEEERIRRTQQQSMPHAQADPKAADQVPERHSNHVTSQVDKRNHK
ncbi:MAG TPA: DUF4349 domain-containing protein, partial [Clostridiaceae bacterium]|nr:DUF4349 domain-containing protein [Clostridiaceae bacterium]